MQRNTFFLVKSKLFGTLKNGPGKPEMVHFSHYFRSEMKKTKLSVAYVIDFELIGLVAPVKEYRLAWHLNQLGHFDLVKTDDIKMEFADKRSLSISRLSCATDFYEVHLLRNKLMQTNVLANQYVVNELQQFDYLLKLRHQIQENWSDELLLGIKQLPIVEYALKIDLDKVKMKDNLLF